MLRYAALRKKPRDLLALTGLARREFEELLPVFEQALPQPAQRRKRRQRAPGGGRKPSLPTAADKLLFVLVYTKTYPIQSVQAHLFGMSQSSANRYLRQLLPVLAEALDRLGVSPERDGPQVAQHERRAGEAPDLIVAGVERRRQRPKDTKTQAIHYSGKKKAHCDKNVIVVNTQTKRVGFLSQTLPGVVHDKTLAEHVAIRYPRQSTLRSDLGFLGYAPRTGASATEKKPKTRELSPSEKRGNRKLARARVRAEHAIAGIKICRITKDVFRNLAEGMSDMAMSIATSLHNFRRARRRYRHRSTNAYFG